MLDKKCPEGTTNCIKEGEGHLTCHIVSKSPFKDIPSPDIQHGLRPKSDILEYQLRASGGVKHDLGKPDLSHITYELVELVARVREFGAKKYARNNWKKGFKQTRSLAAALRHIFLYLGGENNDNESGLSHLGHAVCCIEHCIHDALYRPENDDRNG